MASPNPRGWIGYTTDNGTAGQYYGSENDALAMGNALEIAGASPALSPRIRKRYVWGLGSDGTKRKFYAGSPTNTNYLQGGTLSPGGTSATYALQGRVGEKDRGISKD